MKNQRGYTLLELGLTIGVSLVLGAVVIGMANAGGEGSREQEAINQIHALAQLAGDRTGIGATAANGIDQGIIAGGFVPEGWVVRNGGTANLRGAWGGTMSMDSVTLFPGSAYADGVRINAQAMPSSICTRLLMSTAAAAHSSNVGGVVFKAPDGSLAITRDRAAAVCAASISQTVAFIYATR